MGILDWIIVVSLLVLLTISALYTNRYTKNAVDFLAANRCAGRYLVSVAGGMAGLGAITIVANFEMFYSAGFAAAWWQFLWVAVGVVIPLSGWFVYRYRETRALTLAEFLETRYSRRFRLFAGFVGYFSGIINFGIFPSVGARFFIFFLGIPDTLTNYAIIMAGLIGFALFFTYLGGQIAVMITDFIQGTFCSIVFIAVVGYFLLNVDWDVITQTLLAGDASNSMIHPFHTDNAKDFNIWFYLIQAFMMFYIMGSWQGNQGYNACAVNSHEARMGGILFTWRVLPQNLFMMLIPIMAYVYLHNPQYASVSGEIQGVLDGIANPQIQEQVRTTVTSRFVLPSGLLGGMVAVMLAAFISTHDTYMHSWGSIFIQDIVMPFRKKELAPKEHIRWLRFSILGVAVFIFLFSLIFRHTEYILMFFAITGAIFTGGAGAVVLGGLYWKKGTTPAAWAAMITGSSLAATAVLLKQFLTADTVANPILKAIVSQNGMVLSFYASMIAILVYVIVSLATCKKNFNMDKLLNRGKYAVEEFEKQRYSKKVSSISKLLGMGAEFKFVDKIIYLSTMLWTGLLVTLFVTGCVVNLFMDTKVGFWSEFWKHYIYVVLSVSILTTCWFTVGGIKDVKKLFMRLSDKNRENNNCDLIVSSKDERS